MKYFLSVFMFVFLWINSFTQSVHFIYMQTKDKQPFFVRIGSNVFSSTLTGYLVIPKLTDSKYLLDIGFPKNEWPEQVAQVTIDRKDLGFELSNMGDKGWGLLNLQDMRLTMLSNSTQINVVPEKQMRTDSFSTMLAAAINDPSIRQINSVAPVKVKTDTVQINDNPVIVPVTGPNMAVVGVPYERSTVKKLMQNSASDGMEFIYVDSSGTKSDTIRAFIPADKSNSNVAVQPVTVNQTPKIIDTDVSSAPIKTYQVKGDSIVIINKPIEKEVVPVAATNSNCKQLATNDDFLNLRRNMAAGDDDNDMITIARKVFAKECFSTEQIRNLSYLFLDEKGKCSFFEVAYTFVSDAENFASLGHFFTEDAYIKRFKALIQQ